MIGGMEHLPVPEKEAPRVLALKAGLLALWAAASFGVCFFARDLQFMLGKLAVRLLDGCAGVGADLHRNPGGLCDRDEAPGTRRCSARAGLGGCLIPPPPHRRRGHVRRRHDLHPRDQGRGHPRTRLKADVLLYLESPPPSGLFRLL
jgi:hypothetical protein